MSRRTDLDIMGKVVGVDDVDSVGSGIVANVIVAIILIVVVVVVVDVMVVIGVGVVGVARGSGRAMVIIHGVNRG